MVGQVSLDILICFNKFRFGKFRFAEQSSMNINIVHLPTN